MSYFRQLKLTVHLRRQERRAFCDNCSSRGEGYVHRSWFWLKELHKRRTKVSYLRFEILSFLILEFSAAEVTITIKNEGEDAYKPSVYGKSIVVTRRFTKEGNSSYKIKSKDGKTISTKREELSAICDHMNIQVDNPLNILSQGTEYQDGC